MQVVTANTSVSLNLQYFQDIDGIQTYLSDPTNRVLACDQLARGMNITALNISLVGYTGVAPDPTLATTAINTYLTSLVPGQIFIMGDLLSGLFAAGLTGIQSPVSVNYINYTRDLFPPNTGVIYDVYDPVDPTNIYVLNSVATSSAVPA